MNEKLGIGPQSNIQAALKTSDRGDFGPRVAREQVMNDRMVDFGLGGGRADGTALDCLVEVQGDNTNHLGGRVVAGVERPRSRMRLGRDTLGSSHSRSLIATGLESLEGNELGLDSSCGSSNDVGYYQHLERLEPDVAKKIDTYAPEMNPAHWAVIECFVRESVAAAEPDRFMTAKLWTKSVAYFVLWAWQSACVPLERDAIFTTENISRYVDSLETARSTKATTRSALRRVASRLQVAAGIDNEYRSYAGTKGSVPYTADQLVRIHSFVFVEPTEHRRFNLRLLVALGAGAGLSPRELLQVRSEDVEVRPNATIVSVRGTAPRTVPLLAGYEHMLGESLETARPGLLVLPDWNQRNKATISNFLTSCRGSGLKPQMQRLRSTWLVTQLNARTPMHILAPAAGFQRLAAFDRYMSYVSPVATAAPVLTTERDGTSVLREAGDIR